MSAWKTAGIACGLLAALGAFAVEAKWIDLFNGKDLDGWEQKGGAAKFSVENGTIMGTSVPNTDNAFLCTKQQFRDFELEFEFKGHLALNSGVQFRTNCLPEYKRGRLHGYQCELEEESLGRNWSCGIYDQGRSGWLFPKKNDREAGDAFSRSGAGLWKKGEWNKIRIEAKGNRIRTWLNGTLRVDTNDELSSGGFVALQVHGVGKNAEPMSVYWRNIRIREL